MRLLADENMEAASVAWLREMGHDVLWAAEDAPSMPDSDLLERANAAARIVLTRDRDFGQLVFGERRVSYGIILLRLRARNQWERLPLLQSFWPEIERNAAGHFLVVNNDRVRIRALHAEA